MTKAISNSCQWMINHFRMLGRSRRDKLAQSELENNPRNTRDFPSLNKYREQNSSDQKSYKYAARGWIECNRIQLTLPFSPFLSAALFFGEQLPWTKQFVIGANMNTDVEKKSDRINNNNNNQNNRNHTEQSQDPLCPRAFDIFITLSLFHRTGTAK